MHKQKGADAGGVGDKASARFGQIATSAARYVEVAYGNDDSAPWAVADVMKEYIDYGLTERLTLTIRRVLKSDMMLAVVFNDQNPQHYEDRHEIGVSSFGALGYANRDGLPYLCVIFECSKAAEIFISIVENPRLAPLVAGVLDTLYHELGHMKGMAYGRTARMDKHVGGLEMLATLYSLSRTEGDDIANGIGALAATYAIMHYLKPNVPMEEIVDRDTRRFTRNLDLQDAGITRFDYFDRQTRLLRQGVRTQVISRAAEHFSLLENQLGKAATWEEERKTPPQVVYRDDFGLK